MKRLIQTVIAGAVIGGAYPALAGDDVVLDESVSDVIEMNASKPRHHARQQIRDLIQDYQLENGDLTQQEIDDRAAEREATREELRALREAGDTEALEERLAELREQRQQRRDEIKDYISEHEDLQEQIAGLREEFRERRRERREERRERRRNNDEG